MKTLFDKVNENNIPYDNHYSDLYIPVNDITQNIINEYEYKSIVKRFISQIDGKAWFDVPFAYMPYWENKLNKE